MAKVSKKQQQELDGFERPSIPELDETCVEVAKAEVQKKKVVDKLKQATANREAIMIAKRDEGALEKSGENEHVYVFRDGDTIRECYIRNSTEVGTREHKRVDASAKGSAANLSVVPDEDGDID